MVMLYCIFFSGVSVKVSIYWRCIVCMGFLRTVGLWVLLVWWDREIEWVLPSEVLLS